MKLWMSEMFLIILYLLALNNMINTVVCVCVCVNVQSQVVSLDMPASALGHQFTNLRLNSQYSFRIRASTAVGAGEPTRVVVASTVSQGKIKPNSRRLQNTFVKLLANACYNLQVLTVSLHS